MKLVFRHFFAVLGGALVAPAGYFLVTTVHAQFTLPDKPAPIALAITPTVTAPLLPTETETPTLLPTMSPTPLPPTPLPTKTPTPTPTATPSPSPTPVPVTSQQLDAWFTTYSSKYSVDRQKLWNVAACESGLNASAKNGDYGGMYQFSAGTWRSTRAAMSADTNPDLRFNPEEAIKTAAFKIATGGLSSWPTCGR